MKRRSGWAERWGPTLLVAAALTVYFFLTRPAAAPAGWGDDFEAALMDAAATKRHVIIAFYSEGCPPCTAMDRTVLGAPAVQEALFGYLPVRLDVNRQREPALRYQVFATPTFVVIDEAGRELARCEGYQTVKEFVTFLKENAPAKSVSFWTPSPYPLIRNGGEGIEMVSSPCPRTLPLRSARLPPLLGEREARTHSQMT